jgi:hypothetical protein
MEVSEFWMAEPKKSKDPNWNVFEYKDGAVQFICEHCQESVWKGREVVMQKQGNYMLQAHLNTETGNVFCCASGTHGFEPDHYSAYQHPHPDNIGDEELFLWVLLTGWSLTEDGPKIDLKKEYTVSEMTELSLVDVKETKNSEKSTFEDVLNIGIAELTPGDNGLI